MTRTRRCRWAFIAAALAVGLAWAVVVAHAGDTPRRGGILLATIAAEPRSLAR